MVAAHTVAALLADDIDPEPLLDRAAEEAAYAVRLPVGGRYDLVDRGALLAAEEGEDLILLAGLLGRRRGSFAGFGGLAAGDDRNTCLPNRYSPAGFLRGERLG